MIVRTANPIEPEILLWMQDELGRDDAAQLQHWLSDKFHSNDEYFASLLAVFQHTQQQGPIFIKNLVAHTRKSKEQQQTEDHLRAWFVPRANKAMDTVRRFNGAEEAWKYEYDALVRDLEFEIKRAWPGRHRATRKGGIACALKLDRDKGEISLDIPQLAESLCQADPLAESAAYSEE